VLPLAWRSESRIRRYGGDEGAGDGGEAGRGGGAVGLVDDDSGGSSFGPYVTDGRVVGLWAVCF
jgi:hypothetical protein